MGLHHGQIIERRVRRSGISITQIARNTHVNRRSVYNWFNQERLNLVIIHRIGRAMDHDFSIDFPDLFSDGDFLFIIANQHNVSWKTKYVHLLEKYNALLKSNMD